MPCSNNLRVSCGRVGRMQRVWEGGREGTSTRQQREEVSIRAEGQGPAVVRFDREVKGSDKREVCLRLLSLLTIKTFRSLRQLLLLRDEWCELLRPSNENSVLHIPWLFHSLKYPPHILLADSVRLVGCKVAPPCGVWKAGLNQETVLIETCEFGKTQTPRSSL